MYPLRRRGWKGAFLQPIHPLCPQAVEVKTQAAGTRRDERILVLWRPGRLASTAATRLPSSAECLPRMRLGIGVGGFLRGQDVTIVKRGNLAWGQNMPLAGGSGTPRSAAVGRLEPLRNTTRTRTTPSEVEKRMRQVTLSRQDAEFGLLPPVCIVCGRTSAQTQSVRLFTAAGASGPQQPRLGLLGLLRRSLVVLVPVCGDHQNPKTFRANRGVRIVALSSDTVTLANVAEAFASQWAAGAARRIAPVVPLPWADRR